MNPIVKRIKNRLHKRDQNYLAIVCGATGSGKSEVSIELARLISPKFTSAHIVFTVEEFFLLLNSGKLKRGDVIVWEEIGVAADNRQFFTLQNRAITYCFETFRWLNLAVIMNLPGLGMVDSRVKKLAHQYIETVKINRKKRLCRCKLMDIEYNPRIDKLYFKYPRIVINEEIFLVDSIDFNKPPDYLVIPYKKKKKKFTETLNLNLSKEIETSKIDKSQRVVDVSSIVKEVLADRKRFVHRWGGRGRVKPELIQARFNTGLGTARKAAAAIEDELLDIDSK